MYTSENANTAVGLIAGGRQADYGHPEDNLQDIADVWQVYAARAMEDHTWLNATDVANMMVLLKTVRQVKGYHKDSVVDIMGYAALAEIFNDEKARKLFNKKVSDGK